MAENLPTPPPAGPPPATPPADKPSATPTPPEPTGVLTQEQIDAIVKRRLGIAQKQWETDATEKAKQATMSETDKLKAELEAAKKATADTLTAAQRRIIKTEAKVFLLAEGANPERLEFLLRATDLSAVEFDGEDPDLTALGAAVAGIKKAIPEAFGQTVPPPPRSGADFQGGSQNQKRIYSEAEIDAMSSEEFAKVQDDVMTAMGEPGTPRLRPA